MKTPQMPMSPPEMLKQVMEEYGIGRETAIMLLAKTFEASLRVEGELTEKAVNRKIAELFLTEGRNRTPWYVDFMQAYYRERLPRWIKINDEALEAGQDPVTRMSVTENVTMRIAADRIKLARLSKEGRTIEQVTEAGFLLDDERSPEELYSMIAEQMA